MLEINELITIEYKKYDEDDKYISYEIYINNTPNEDSFLCMYFDKVKINIVFQ